jgi:hypothetical protein
VPFWLQVLSIAAAPVIGFIGVAIGATIAERNRRSAYLVDEKKKVYLEFMEMLAKITTFWSNEFTVALRKEPGWQELQGRSKPMIESLYRTYLQIRLVGSSSVVDAAGKSVQFTFLASMTGLKMLATDFDMREWSKVTSYGMEAMVDFSDAARKDLGLPGLEVKESSVSESDKEKVFQYIEKMAYQKGGDSNRTASDPGSTDRPPT